MTGGAGEGTQRLRPESNFEEREQVKTDSVLPAYCDPPNPCPVGYSAADGCLEDFDNTAEFSRMYQSSQNCACDREHMFNCPSKGIDELEESIQKILDQNGLHKNLIAKKFHEKRESFMVSDYLHKNAKKAGKSGRNQEPRRKRSIFLNTKANSVHNPYLQGEILRTVSKKDGRNLY
uniref:Neuroendocrine protein 7B2 n=1 Tax=Syphacia muris TaxID=451379 RepID=A0A0N5A8R5_9BILA